MYIILLNLTTEKIKPLKTCICRGEGNSKNRSKLQVTTWAKQNKWAKIHSKNSYALNTTSVWFQSNDAEFL